jgi:hypothetical protein
MPKDPEKIIRDVIAKGAYVDLLLGAKKYAYVGKWSCCSGDTDLVELLGVLYYSVGKANVGKSNIDQVRCSLTDAIDKIVGTYEGIDPTTTVILFECLEKTSGRRTLGLDVENIASKLRESIGRHYCRLCGDKSGEGKQWEDGMFGAFRRLRKIIISDCNGPDILPDALPPEAGHEPAKALMKHQPAKGTHRR